MSIIPFPYSIPDEYICDINLNKKQIFADLIPGEIYTYRFDHTQELEYLEMYQESRFAITQKKGGWDSLRNYEIIANGCIPYFKNIENCPNTTMISFPKILVKEAMDTLLPWKNTQEFKDKYNYYLSKILDWCKYNCSTSVNTNYFLKNIQNGNKIKNVLLLSGHPGVNYTRELFWIGMKRYLYSIGGKGVDYPKIEFLYDSYPIENLKNLHGKGFIYSRKLKEDYDNSLSDEKIKNSILNKEWDIIVFGKTGPDEFETGTIPGMKFWDIVYQNYPKEKIIFLYGGDGCQDLNLKNNYTNHLIFHQNFGICFVRELNF